MPSASAADAMVEAVPIVMQVPNERAMPSSISTQALSSILPARFSAQYFQTSEPEPLAVPIAAQHRPCGQEDCRQVHRCGPHQHRRHGLVATAHQHHAVDRIGAQQFLDVHRQKIAVEHRRGLHERLAQRHGRHLQGKAAGLVDAALHVFDAGFEMVVAGIGVAERVDDRDDRFARIVFGRKAHLLCARAMPEGTHILRAVPAMRTQFFRLFLVDGHLVSPNPR
jgi:hypothetical protein